MSRVTWEQLEVGSHTAVLDFEQGIEMVTEVISKDDTQMILKNLLRTVSTQ